VFGRALDAEGKPVANTVPQENYVEDRFNVPVVMQQALAKALADAGGKRFRLADDLARLLVSHAYLGQLDVNPVGGPGGVPTSKGSLKECEFWAQPAASRVASAPGGTLRLQIEGKSEAAGVPADDQKVDGRLWQHEVKLDWEGIIEIREDRMSRLLVTGRGSEKLKWGNKGQQLKGQADVTVLPGGHAIDLACGVRYGIIGEPVSAEEAGNADQADIPAAGRDPAGQVAPDQARRQLVEALGGAFIVFRDKVLEELKLSDDQKGKLLQKFPDHVQETMKVFEKIKDLKSPEREREMEEHRRKSGQKLSALLKDVLDAKQQERLFQVQLQQAGVFALLGQNEAFFPLKITDEQRKQFMDVVQGMHKEIETVLKDFQNGGNPEEIRPKVMKIRKEYEGKVEKLLSDAQKKQWKELLGKPFDLAD
jgi:hypothetical protein